MPPGSEWNEEACDAFEDLTHCARWKVIMSKAIRYKKTPRGVVVPSLELIDTTGEEVIIKSPQQDTHLIQKSICVVVQYILYDLFC